MLGCGLDLDLNLDLHNHSVFELDFNYELDLDFDIGHDLDIDLNLVHGYDFQPDVDLDWKSSLSRELSAVSVQVRELVPGWGGWCLAENKDHLKFELIKIRLHGLSSQGP